MFHIVLYEPEIPPNTGAIMRLAANTGCSLHLIEPLGFFLDDKRVKRAGLDYEMLERTRRYKSFDSYLSEYPDSRLFLCTTKASGLYSDVQYQPGDSFVYGPETRGLPDEILNQYPSEAKIRIPMHEKGRSLNLATAVSIITYEAWRQVDFAQGVI